MAIPHFFKAAIYSKPKAQLNVSDRSLSAAVASGEVGIKITATAVNPVDWKIRDSGAFISTFPAVLGSDAAGVVASVGPDVTGFTIGDRVFFQGIIGNIDSSTFQQFCKLPAALVAKTPSNISDEEAAGISLATIAVVTAFYADQGHGIAPPWVEGGEQAGSGKAVVILGGSSSVGQYAIQLARLSGFTTIITNASPVHHEFLKKLGASVVLDRSTSDAEKFKAALNGTPLDFVFDAISTNATQVLGVQIIQAVGSLKPHVVTVQQVDPEASALGAASEPKIVVKQVLGLGSSPGLRYLSEPLAKHLGGEDGYIARGLFTPNRPRVVPGGLEAVEEALSLNKNGVSGEKVVFSPSES